MTDLTKLREIVRSACGLHLDADDTADEVVRVLSLHQTQDELIGQQIAEQMIAKIDYATQRLKDARDQSPDWEALWAEQAERADKLAEELARRPEKPHGEVMDELDHAYRLAQESPGGVITSAELIRRCGGDPDAPFDRGPFPPEMREQSSLTPTLTQSGAGEPVVKALVWEPVQFGHRSGLYRIEDQGPNWKTDRYWFGFNGKVIGKFGSEEDAMKAAQEHRNADILSALSPPPPQETTR